MREVLDALHRWREDGLAAGRAVVVRVVRGAPFREGATLVVADDGRIAGGVSGGCVEGEAAEAIAAARRCGSATLVRLGIADERAWAAGLACGGAIDVLVEPRVPPEVEAAAAGPGGVAVATVLPGHEGTAVPAARAVVGADGRLISGTLGSADLDAGLAVAVPPLLAAGESATVSLGDREVFVEVFATAPRLVIVGGSPVAVPLVDLARQVGFHTVVVDPRGAFADPDRFAAADEVILGWPDEVADQAGIDGDAFVAVLTHDPKVDDSAIAVALRRGARYVGAIGSGQTQRGRRERLRELGLSEAEIARLRGPIGLDLGGRSPAEIALAIVSEIVAVRRGGSGAPLAGARARPSDG